jgi:hypothetical protein
MKIALQSTLLTMRGLKCDFMSTKIAAVLILLGVAGIWHSLEMSVSNSMKAYALQDSDVGSQGSILFFVSFGALFVGAILLELDRRKNKNRKNKP